MRTFTASEEAKLAKCHPDLVKIVREANKITKCDFQIGETSRSVAQQRANIAKGVSWTMNSRHIVSKDGLSRAVDLLAVPKGKVVWQWFYYYQIRDAMKPSATKLGIPMEWGGDWKKTKDGPHYQLPWSKYP